MDNNELQQLIKEASGRGGGLLLNFNDKPAVVVLTVEKYNQLLNNPGLSASVVPSNSPTPAKKNTEKRQVLVTGGAGYIGAHLVRRLIKSGYKVVVLDNLSTGKRENLSPDATFVEGDLSDVNLLRDIFATSHFEAVFHMAASIEVEESVKYPQKYFENNVGNTGKLLAAMEEAGIKNIIFSSTAAVYGEQQIIPITETAETRPNNPYGASKLLAEKLIEYYVNYAGFNAIVFRYFNACGCDFDGDIFATHHSHLIPIVLEVALGKRPFLPVHGGDYETFDGTCIRDYVHVLDIAEAHVLALDAIAKKPGLRIYNIGTGHGISVKQIINSAAEVLNRIIPMEIGPRRAGDAPATVADNTKLIKELGYKLQHSDLETIISTSWKQLNNQINNK